MSDLLDLRWNKRAALGDDGLVEAPYIAPEGIYFKPGTTSGSTAPRC